MPLTVPFIDLKAQHEALAPELSAAFMRVLHSGQFILGREVDAFEQCAAALTGAKHAIGVSSGTDALLLALMTLDIGPGDEVLCPAFTFFATAGSVARLGATPVFVDCLADSFNIDPADAARRITARTKAMIPVHLYGQMADMPALEDLARKQKLWLIEDAAQALGASFDGKRAGSFGDFGVFSFFPTKNLGALGDAGLLVTNNDELARAARLLRNHGAEQQYIHKKIGGNFRLDALQAAFLNAKLPHLDRYTAARRSHADYYTAAWKPLAEDGAFVLPMELARREHIRHQYTIRVAGNQRDSLRAFLAERGVGSAIYYPVPLHRQECFSRAPGNNPVSLPVSEKLANECLSLPVYPELEANQLRLVVDSVSEFALKRLLRLSAKSPQTA